ncbi:hypothetical protein [uncultured Acinetobacter sp.]|uniref:hypothetical protein n=1 Tax=uncultured Acinetobacter sp. TaxID=165433 RepID=UPI002639B362|nr:hypothetical protein [uncultured Acinetobacter sp.]
MTALTLKLIFATLVGLGIFFLAMGFYANDHIYLVIGTLLECAAALVFPEIRRVHRHPFR